MSICVLLCYFVSICKLLKHWWIIDAIVTEFQRPRRHYTNLQTLLNAMGPCTSSCFSLSTLQPLTSSWPHLRCDVGLEEGEYK